MSPIPIPLLYLFPLISLCALYAVSSLFIKTEHYALFQSVQESANPFIFQDGITLLETFYTGIPPLDHYLTNLQLIFKNVIDGSRPDLSNLGLQFGGAMLGVFTAMLCEAVIVQGGGIGQLIIFALWGLAIQYCGYFVTMPLYCFFHLRGNDTRNNAANISVQKKTSPSAIASIPLSLIVGFILPSMLLCLPTLFSPSARQRFLALIWQNFPIWVSLLQYTLPLLLPLHSAPPSPPSPSRPNKHFTTTTSSSKQLSPINKAIVPILAICTLLHLIGSVAIALASLPTTTSTALMTEEIRQRLHYTNFLMPPFWADADGKLDPETWVADGAFNFLRYDYFFGTLAAVIWAGVMRSAGAKRGIVGLGVGGVRWGTMAGEVVRVGLWGMVAGPAGLILILMRERWQAALEAAEKWDRGEKKVE